MKILLAIDESECSQAATRSVIAQFPRECADVRVLNVDEWPNRLPTSLAFAEGPTAASDILDVREQRRRQGEEVVARAARQLEAAGFHASTAVREGDAASRRASCATPRVRSKSFGRSDVLTPAGTV